MGELADKARAQSNFLILNKGEWVVVKYIGFRFVPSQLDPSKDVVQYKLVEDGREKFWTNGSSAVMRYMDNIKPGSFIKISRDKAVNKDGREDTTKSKYSVIEVSALGKVLRPEEEQAATPEKEKAWDE